MVVFDVVVVDTFVDDVVDVALVVVVESVVDVVEAFVEDVAVVDAVPGRH